ncbi:hypothetical protein BH18THE2_BH18THE2_38050 [soil metagenome]
MGKIALWYKNPFNFTRRLCFTLSSDVVAKDDRKKQVILSRPFLVLTRISLVLPLGFVLLLSHFYPASGYYGQDVLLSLDSAEYMPLKKVEGNQVEVFVKYMVNNSSIINKQINCVMKVSTLMVP